MKKLIIFILLFVQIKAAISQETIVDTLVIQSKVFNSSRKIKVSLPANYFDYPDQKYIVVYLFDSQSDDFFNFFKTTVNFLTGQGYINHVILVGIASDNRQYEFTPAPETPEGVKDFMKSGGANLLALHLQDEVMPAIAKKYHCINYNIGIGHSLGATFIINCLLRFPNLFNASIAISPNLVFDKRQLVHKFDSISNNKIFDHKFLYLANGSGDYMENKFKPATHQIDSILIARSITGFKWQYHELDNNNHGLTAMEGVFKGLTALFSELSLVTNDSLVNIFYKDTTRPFVENAKAYYQSVSTWAGIRLPLIDDINSVAYNCYYSNKKKEAIDLFTWALTLFPENINLHDSMGEIQQGSGNKKEALYYYTKGLKIANDQKSKLSAKAYNGIVEGFRNRIKSLDK